MPGLISFAILMSRPSEPFPFNAMNRPASALPPVWFDYHTLKAFADLGWDIGLEQLLAAMAMRGFN